MNFQNWEGEGESPQPLIWGCSSAGRAPALHAGGHRFDPDTLHHDNILKDSNPNGRNPFLLYTACLYLNEDACTMQIACSQVFFTVNNNCAFVEFGSRKMS